MNDIDIIRPGLREEEMIGRHSYWLIRLIGINNQDRCEQEELKKYTFAKDKEELMIFHKYAFQEQALEIFQRQSHWQLLPSAQ